MNEYPIFVIIINMALASLLAVGTTPIMVWWERRIAGFMQDRAGPNRCHIYGVRLGGLIQSFADMLKLVFKEDFRPPHIKNKYLYTLAPVIVFFCSFMLFGVIPFADDLIYDSNTYKMQVIPFDLGIMWFLAFASISIYGIMLGGYSSDNKYSLLGAIRAGAQVISYEAAMGLSLISLIITYGSIHINDMVAFQGGLLWGVVPAWGIIIQPIASILFIVTAFAETNRAPFDIAEGESEIVAGYHTEYSAMRFGLFQVGEYAAMTASCAIIVSLVFGGYQVPFLTTNDLKESLDIVLPALIAITAIGGVVVSLWLAKNNNWVDKTDIRAKENKFLIMAICIISALACAFLAFLYVSDRSENTTNLIVMSIQIITFLIKFFVMAFVFIWVRWTLLRFRYDQLQALGWKVLLPLAIINILVSAIVIVV